VVRGALAKGAAGKVGGVFVAKAAAWLKGDELDRLLEAVAERLAPGVGVAALAPLRESESVVELVAAFIEHPDSWDERELVRAIEPFVGPMAEEGSATETAERIAALIKESAWIAFKDDREAIVHTVRNEVRPLADLAAPRYLSEEWVPRQALEPVRRLSKEQPGEAARLEQALADESHRPRELANLIKKPQRWVTEGSSALWATLADLALAYADFNLAEAALLEAAERPGADRVRLLSRAAQVARIRGDAARASALLADARELDPDHPAVAIAEARQTEDPKRRLEILEAVEPQDDAQAANVESDRALSFLALGDYAAARKHRDLAVARDLNSPVIRELTPTITLIESGHRSIDEQVDWVALAEAAAEFRALRDELLSLGRDDEAAGMLAKACESYNLAGDRRRARTVVDTITDEERGKAGDEAIRYVASAALDSGRPELARQLIDDHPQDERDRLLLAQALLATERDPSAALELLTQIIDGSEDERYRGEAGRIWLMAATDSDDVAWSDAAHDAVVAVDAPLADIFTAAKLKDEESYAEAEKLLLPQQNDSRALQMLAEIAAARGDWKTAAQFQKELLARAPTPERRLREARLFEQSGDTAAFLASLASLRTHANVVPDVRAIAFGLSADTLYRTRKLSDFVDVARAWRAFRPDDDVAGWALVRGLAHLARWEDALAVVDGQEQTDGHESRPLATLDEEDAVLAATVLANALPTLQSIPRIAALSDQFNRNVERLEALVIITGAGATDDFPAEVSERRALTWSDFQERFPDSQIIRAFDAPTTREELEDFARQHVAPGSDTGVELHEQVIRGEAAVALLAAGLGKHVAEVWAGAQLLPLGYGDATLDEVEVADATAAIGKPAVWDASAFYVAGGLGDEVVDAATNILPASVLAQSTLEDIAASASGPVADADGEQTLLGWDQAAGQPRLTIIPADEVARQRAALSGVFTLARSLRSIEDADPLSPGRYDELVTWADDRPSAAFLSWPATFAVAARLELPIYSDDRYIRLEARRAGIPTFGTPALLDALVQEGHLTADIRDRARRRLRISYGAGLVPPAEQVVEEARSAGWRLDELVGRALLDPTGWRHLDDGFRNRIPFLETALAEAPAEFADWVMRVLDAARTVHPKLALDNLASVMLAHCWMSRNTAFAIAVTDVMRELRHLPGMRINPIPQAFQLLVVHFHDKPRPVRQLVIRLAMRAVRPDEHLAFIDLHQRLAAAASGPSAGASS
jgi:tetratricopeptide (TPR) repeat protein